MEASLKITKKVFLRCYYAKCNIILAYNLTYNSIQAVNSR